MTLHRSAAGIFLGLSDNGHLHRLDEHTLGQVQASMTELVAHSQPHTDDRGRTRWDTYQTSMEMFEARVDAIASELSQRNDSAGLGMFQPRDLVHKMRRSLEEKRPPLNYRKVFDLNTEVPPGALKYEQYRTYSSGEAVVYRGGNGNDVPEVAVANTYFTAPVVYLITRMSVNWLEQLRVNMAGLNTQRLKQNSCIRAIGEAENTFTFEGSEAYNIYGLLNHPYVDKIVSALDFGTATAQQMSDALQVWANYAEEESGSTFQPDTMLISPKLYNFIVNKKFGSGDPETVLERFRKSNPHITRIEKVRELNDAGPVQQPGHRVPPPRVGAGRPVPGADPDDGHHHLAARAPVPGLAAVPGVRLRRPEPDGGRRQPPRLRPPDPLIRLPGGRGIGFPCLDSLCVRRPRHRAFLTASALPGAGLSPPS